MNLGEMRAAILPKRIGVQRPLPRLKTEPTSSSIEPTTSFRSKRRSCFSRTSCTSRHKKMRSLRWRPTLLTYKAAIRGCCLQTSPLELQMLSIGQQTEVGMADGLSSKTATTLTIDIRFERYGRKAQAPTHIECLFTRPTTA